MKIYYPIQKCPYESRTFILSQGSPRKIYGEAGVLRCDPDDMCLHVRAIAEHRYPVVLRENVNEK